MNVGNVVLWHLEDKTDRTIRKEKYLAESRKWMENREDNGKPVVFVPDDGDRIQL